MRKRVFEIIEKSQDGDILSTAYDLLMIICIVASIIPLCFKVQTPFMQMIDKITARIFIMDYVLRLMTADYINEKHKLSSFLLHPFRPMAIIDLLSILPSFINVNHALKIFRILRLFKTLRVVKVVRYSKNIRIITNVIYYKKDALITVGVLAISYIFITALIIFQVEPASFDTFFEAIYWATVSLTTVGYGDIYPLSMVGRIISMISSFLGIAVVALPAGIIMAGYQEELEKEKDRG